MSETKAEYVVSDKPADFVAAVCEWKWSTHTVKHERTDWWNGACGNSWLFDSVGDVSEWKFCPFCGKVIKVTP